MKSGRPAVTQSLFVEAVLLVVVIAITAVMVGTSPTATASSSTFSATQIQSDIVADFSILPTRVGVAEIHVYLTPPGGSLKPVSSVKMSFTLPSRDIPAIPVDLIEVGPNHWSGVMQFPYSGEWSMETRVQPKPNSTLLYTASVPIND
jgi:copper transport protein